MAEVIVIGGGLAGTRRRCRVGGRRTLGQSSGVAAFAARFAGSRSSSAWEALALSGRRSAGSCDHRDLSDMVRRNAFAVICTIVSTSSRFNYRPCGKRREDIPGRWGGRPFVEILARQYGKQIELIPPR